MYKRFELTPFLARFLTGANRHLDKHAHGRFKQAISDVPYLRHKCVPNDVIHVDCPNCKDLRENEFTAVCVSYKTLCTKLL